MINTKNYIIIVVGIIVLNVVVLMTTNKSPEKPDTTEFKELLKEYEKTANQVEIMIEEIDRINSQMMHTQAMIQSSIKQNNQVVLNSLKLIDSIRYERKEILADHSVDDVFSQFNEMSAYIDQFIRKINSGSEQ